ncbi:hypothetical protein AVEN_4534-1 [Araneus ventricosus]|uniref:Uncharacterized protein n=1 Tax=Araneus ventricosus TaxID=182803 RepID=A0A4Y2BNI6_ARAVE|nr:hypothetical protein AVEN_4534-1 [Araneus ventricosus]
MSLNDKIASSHPRHRQTLARANSIARKERQFLQRERQRFLRKETQSDSSSPLGEDEDWNRPRSYQFSIKQNFASACERCADTKEQRWEDVYHFMTKRTLEQ